MGSRANGQWIQTHTGKMFYALDPQPEDIDLEDIAHSLSMQVRYTGHAPEAYTIAQHSVMVSKRAEELAKKRGLDPFYCRSVARFGLMHDATEAYLVDVPRPIKPMLTNYAQIEASVMDAIAARFELGPEGPEVKQADNDTLITEAAMFFPVLKRPAPWSVCGVNYHPEGFAVWSRSVSKEEFLHRALQLGIV